MLSRIQRVIGRSFGQLMSPPGRRARLLVFCYHQVLARRDPMRPGEPDIDEFSSDLDCIKELFEVLPLSDAIEALKAGALPARAAVITFDDGYQNNLSLAAPALLEHGLPATFFVTCGAIEKGVMWNDLVIDGVASASDSLNLAPVRPHVEENLDELRPSEQAARIIGAIKYLPIDERWRMAEQFYKANASPELPRLMMSREEVAALARMGFEIGGHTMTHPILKELSDDRARAEIDDSLTWLSEVVGARPRSFAYPNGRPGTDFAPVHKDLVREAGCDVAVTTEWATGNVNTDPYAVPRIGPWWRQGNSLIGGLTRIYAKSYL